MRCRVLFITASAMVAVMAPSVSVEAIQLQPGLWEVSRKIVRDGVVTQRPTRTKCVTPENAKLYSQQAFPTSEFSARGRTCKIINPKSTDKEVRGEWNARGVPLGAGCPLRHRRRRALASELRSSVKLPKKTLSSISTTEGRRIGECPK